MSCPRCREVESDTLKHFQLDDLDMRIRCDFCSKRLQVKDWLCPCGDPWYLCDKHWSTVTSRVPQSSGSVQKSREPNSSTELGGSRALLKHIGPPDEVLLLDARREIARSRARRGTQPEQLVCLGNRPSSLSAPTLLQPILAQRFGSSRPRASSS